MPAGEPGAIAVGLDVGTARTKIALAGGDREHPSAAARGPGGWLFGDDVLAVGDAEVSQPLSSDLLGRFIRHVLPVEPRHARVVAAVPARWVSSGGGFTAPAHELRRLLTEEVGVHAPVLVPGLQCVAAAHLVTSDSATSDSVLVCDVGAGTVAAAVCAVDGTTTRLFETQRDEADRIRFQGELLGRAGARCGVALDEERCRRAPRARVVLDRAATHPRYLGTPVYLDGDHGRWLTAETVCRALEPLAATAADVVRRLLDRVPEPLAPELVVTGGNAMGPVLPALLEAAGGRVRKVRSLSPTAAARGALLIAAGRAVAHDGYPHILGLAARRVRDGLLESLTMPFTGPGEGPVAVTVTTDHRGPLAVRVKVDGAGPWRTLDNVESPDVPPGRYEVALLPGRGRFGAVTLRPANGGGEIIQVLGHEPGAVVNDNPRSPT